MSGARQSYGRSAATFSRAQARLERVERGEPVDMIARRDGTSRGAVLRDLRLAREETGSAPRETMRPRRRMSERAMLFRAWTVTRYLNVFRILPPDLSRVWLEVVMEIHLNSDGDLWFGPRCASLAELARGVRASEADIEELISRDLLIRLEEGIALPEDLGLRPPERVGGKAAGSGATPPQRRREPDGRQAEILMGMPPSRPNVESANVESPPSVTQPNGPRNLSQLAEVTQFSTLAGGKGTTTTTKDSESFPGGGGGDLEAARGPETASSGSVKPESPPADSANVESANVESPAPDAANVESDHAASLGAELLALVGRSGTATTKEQDLVRAWLETHTANDIREAVGSRMEQRNAPRAPDLSFFDKRVREWAPRLPATPVPARPPEPPEDPVDTVALLTDDPDNPLLVQAWTPMRATLKAEIGEAEYRTWIRGMKLGGLDGDEVVLLLPSGFAADFVRDHHGVRITALWKQTYPEARRVDFRIGNGP